MGICYGCEYFIFFFYPFPIDLPIPSCRLSYGCCLDIDATRVSDRLLLCCYIWTFTRWRWMFLLTHLFVAPEPPPHFLKYKSLPFRCSCFFYCRLFWRTAPHFPVFHLKIFLVGDSNAAFPREGKKNSVFSCLLTPSIHPSSLPSFLPSSLPPFLFKH